MTSVQLHPKPFTVTLCNLCGGLWSDHTKRAKERQNKMIRGWIVTEDDCEDALFGIKCNHIVLLQPQCIYCGEELDKG